MPYADTYSGNIEHQTSTEVVNETFCRKVVNAAKGTKLPYDVLSYRPWILSIKVAKSYRAN
jgi:hypothetical protein